MRDLGFTENVGLEVGGFRNTDGVEFEAGFEVGFVGSLGTGFGAAGVCLVTGTVLFPFSARCGGAFDAIFDEIFPAANGEGVVAFSFELGAGSPFPSSPSTA